MLKTTFYRGFLGAAAAVALSAGAYSAAQASESDTLDITFDKANTLKVEWQNGGELDIQNVTDTGSFYETDSAELCVYSNAGTGYSVTYTGEHDDAGRFRLSSAANNYMGYQVRHEHDGDSNIMTPGNPASFFAFSNEACDVDLATATLLIEKNDSGGSYMGFSNAPADLYEDTLTVTVSTL